MTSTIKVNKIEKVDGSTIELGGPGTSVNLASGATQTGFGRTGTVDWCTTAKTSPFTSVSGKGYFVNTTSGAVTVTLPASPSAGDIVAVADYANTADTNNITIGETKRFDYSDPEAYKYLKRYGYVIFKNIVNKTEIQNAKTLFWQWETLKLSKTNHFQYSN